jgi:methylated-DNA-[protein]-cysteine S-methyltransferase
MKKVPSSQPCCCLRNTPFGPVAVLWSAYGNRPKILRVLLSRSGAAAAQRVKILFPHFIPASSAEIDGVADQISAFLAGDDIRFSLGMARLDLCSKFQQKVLRAEYAIPRGYVSTYKRIARHIGNKEGARAVGTALAKNPFPIIVPCHRAIRSDGTLGGYQGDLDMKRALLEMEGVYFNDRGRVVTKKIFYG